MSASKGTRRRTSSSSPSTASRCSRRRSAARRTTSRARKNIAGAARRVRQAHDLAAHQGDRRSARRRASRSSSGRTQEQNMWQPVLRASQEAHNPSGHAAAAQRDHRRALQRHRRQRHRRRASGCSSARPTTAAQEAPCADARSCPTVARRAFRRPVTKTDIEAPLAFYRDERDRGRRLRRRHPRRPRAHPHQPVVPVPRRSSDPAALAAGARASRSAISSWRAGCRSSSGAASRTTSC